MSDTPYIVLARKHRPTQLHEVIGQEHVARTLTNAIEQNRVAHALLFTGPRGVGKTSTARILARALNCQTGPTPRPCGECSSCQEILAGASVDVIEIDAASNRGIDEIRDLRDAVRYPPSRERFKVYIIDEVHMLTTQAFNALLKTLEEPPPRIQFIFATTEPHKIPDTILSRCQRYDFRRIPVERIVEHLAAIAALEQVEAEPAALRLIAQQSEGCMRDAQSLLDQLISFSDGKIEGQLAARVLGVIGRDALFRATEAVLAKDVDQVLSIVDDAYQIGVNLTRLASDLLEHLRDLTVAAVTRGEGALLHLTPEERERLAEQAAESEGSVLHRMFSILLETAEEMSRSAYPRLLLEMALIRMTAIEPLEPIGSLVKRIEGLAGGSLPDVGSSAKSAQPRSAAPSVPTPTPAPATPLAKVPTPLAKVPTPPPMAETAPQASPKPNGQSTGTSAKPAEPAPPRVTLTGSHPERWRKLVHCVTERSRSVGELLKAGELEPGEGNRFSVRLGGAHYDILADDERRTLVEATARELVGADAEVILAPKANESGTRGAAQGYSVHDEEDQEREAELDRLRGVVAEHPVTNLLRSVFELDDSQIQITPRLSEAGPPMEPDS